MLIVAALGGNALLRRGEPLTPANQRENARIAARSIAALALDHQVVVTHGNGPQVGLLALQSAAPDGSATVPLDVLGAEAEGMIGYVLEQELANALPEREVVTVLTQVLVDAADPAFQHPTKPIGRTYTDLAAQVLADRHRWDVAPDGHGWRRVVPSPVPTEILELGAIELLVDAGLVVICAGGGGIPVTADESGALHGIDAVVDKDRSAALLAQRLDADALLLLTDVDSVYDGYATDNPRRIRQIGAETIRHSAYPEGSMGPKVEAAAWFARTSGRSALIGAMRDAVEIVARDTGTEIRPGSQSPTYVTDEPRAAASSSGGCEGSRRQRGGA